MRERIERAARTARRNPADIQLIAVSKGRTIDEVALLNDAGLREFGESRVHEALGKWATLRAADPDLRLHCIGRLQSNKAAAAVELFDTVHSLDRSALLHALVAAGNRAGRYPTVYVQVNIGGEAQKGGLAIGELAPFLERVRQSPLPLAGLMAIPPIEHNPAPYFALLAKLARDNGVAGLSMGMSGDVEAAVMLGATAVRVGTALFAD